MLDFKEEIYGSKWKKMFTKANLMTYWMMQTWQPMAHTFFMR